MTSSTSYAIKQIKTDHKDLIQDIAFDFYGKRAATASLDQTVKIWAIKENNEWILKDEIKVNPGLNKVTWAHPEFGSLIAFACDRVAFVYEEACLGNQPGTGKPNSTWIKRTTMNDARAPITDLKFAPRQLGLQLIVCSQNAEIRIYESSDIVTWGSSHQEILGSKKPLNSCSSCSWSTCFNLPVLLAIGSNESSPQESSSESDKLVLFEYNESNNSSGSYTRVDRLSNIICSEPIHSLAFAPSIGKLYHVLAIASKALLVSTIKTTKEKHVYQVNTVTLDPEVSAWRVCWNTVGSILASAGDDKKVRLWKCNYTGSWRIFAEVSGDNCSSLIGQNFHLGELMHRNTITAHQDNDHHHQQQNNKQLQIGSMQHGGGNMSTLHSTPVVGEQVRFSQNGTLNKNKSGGAVWH